jgi:pimeloyl-ACP methyl ester carboxylesterase
VPDHRAAYAERLTNAFSPRLAHARVTRERGAIGRDAFVLQSQLTQAREQHRVFIPTTQTGLQRFELDADQRAARERHARRELVEERAFERHAPAHELERSAAEAWELAAPPRELTELERDLVAGGGDRAHRYERTMSRARAVAQVEAMELTTHSPFALAQAAPAWLDRSLYPFESRYFATPEGRMHYVEQGTGRPILFVHGTPSWSFEWRHAIAQLSTEARCIAVDHLGFGLSDKPPTAAYRPIDHARRLRAFVHELDLRDVVLVVHDFGGPIGIAALLDEPERFSALVVVNSWAWAHADDRRIRTASRVCASGFGRWLYLGLNASARWLLPQSMKQRKDFTRAVHAQYLGPFGSRSERVAPWVLGCELAGSDADYATLWERRHQLQGLKTALVWGMHDPAFGPSYLERWRNALPNARVHRLEGVGHFPQEEAPAQLVAAMRELLHAP